MGEKFHLLTAWSHCLAPTPPRGRLGRYRRGRLSALALSCAVFLGSVCLWLWPEKGYRGWRRATGAGEGLPGPEKGYRGRRRDIGAGEGISGPEKGYRGWRRDIRAGEGLSGLEKGYRGIRTLWPGLSTPAFSRSCVYSGFPGFFRKERKRSSLRRIPPFSRCPRIAPFNPPPARASLFHRFPGTRPHALRGKAGTGAGVGGRSPGPPFHTGSSPPAPR